MIVMYFLGMIKVAKGYQNVTEAKGAMKSPLMAVKGTIRCEK